LRWSVGRKRIQWLCERAAATEEQRSPSGCTEEERAPCAAKKQPPAAAQQKKTPSPTDQAVLLGQFGEWGAYRATPGGKKICFALSKPTSVTSEPSGRTRDAAYAFVSTRPSEKVKNEVSVIVGYPQRQVTTLPPRSVLRRTQCIRRTMEPG
jgi:hypothetical protein